jgi:hypothetical protein
VCSWLCVCEVSLLLSFQDMFILAIILTYPIRELIRGLLIANPVEIEWTSILLRTMKVTVQISDRTRAFFTELFRDFPQPPQANAGKAFKNRLRPLLFTAFQFNY